jgi:ribonucleoside-diphosphate reductase alpha chain
MDTSPGPVAPFKKSPSRSARGNAARQELGLDFAPTFCPEGLSPWSTTTWETRAARIAGPNGKVVFEQEKVEVPNSWSQTATNVVASKYFRGHQGTAKRETSVRQVIERVVNTITDWGREDGYFTDDSSADAFRNDLAWLCLHQHLAFNSPVWFNVGHVDDPQCSACFINSVSDTMESILDLAKTEGMLFKWGSGTGSNLSALRACTERLSTGGTASGPVSFMRGFDAFAGVIKSGGATRRAAKMVILNISHPDVHEFIHCKSDEERKAWALIEAGYDGSFNVPGGAYDSVAFQNSNNSVRVTDEFMRACEEDDAWQTRSVLDGSPVDSYRARDLLQQMAEAAWLCGDPGIQFDTTVNAWNPVINSSRINASNPCSEYMFVDDSACNLSSLNLLRFLEPDGSFDVERFEAACRLAITAQEIIVDRSSYPTEKIKLNSRYYRPLGLGYANLGALLMARGIPYDSEEGHAYAGAVTALMTGTAYAWSARIAEERGPFAGFRKNTDSMMRVIAKHRAAAEGLPEHHTPYRLREAAIASWAEAEQLGSSHGYRNAQVTVLAPTGTIGFMMDCDTTGVEPEFALVKYKKLVGGGQMKIVNRTVETALKHLEYTPEQQTEIKEWLAEKDTIEGAPHLEDEHLPVFDCSFRAANGSRSIEPMGHVRMMAAVQPFISGAISKTVNLPEHYTPENIADVYMESWRLGIKAITVYRDNSKRSQPLSTSDTNGKAAETATAAPATTAAATVAPEVRVEYRPQRNKLPDERSAVTHKFNVAGHEGYVTVGLYDNGKPGELFIVMAKEGSVVSGLMDGFATSVSMALQYGVPLKVLCDKFTHTRFEPSGFTGNPEIPIAKSILDYIFRWLELRFLKGQTGPAIARRAGPGRPAETEDTTGTEPAVEASTPSIDVHTREDNPGPPVPEAAGGNIFVNQADAPPCHECGSIMMRSGSCYKCFNCGATSGCS